MSLSAIALSILSLVLAAAGWRLGTRVARSIAGPISIATAGSSAVVLAGRPSTSVPASTRAITTGATTGPSADPSPIPPHLVPLFVLGAAATVLAFTGAQLPATALYVAPPIAALLGATTALFVDLLRRSLAGRHRVRRIYTGVIGGLVACTLLYFSLSTMAWLIALFGMTLPISWLDRRLGLGRRTQLWCAAVGIILAAGPATNTLVGHLPEGLVKPIIRVGAGLGLAFAFGLAWRLLMQFPAAIFARFRLRTRLVTSYILVAAVPVLLVAAFLIVAAYLAMGSSRADTATRLLMPDAETRRALTGLASDPALSAALAADRHPDDFDSSARDLDLAVTRHLEGHAPFLMAARRARADTNRFVLRFAPEYAVPLEFRTLRAPIPPLPAEALVYAGPSVYATTAVTLPYGDEDLLLRAFAPVDSQRLSDVAEVVSAELQLFTSDSLAVETDGRGVSINFDTGQRGPARRVMSSTPKEGGAQGAFVVRGFMLDTNGTLETHDSILLLQIPPMSILANMRDTASNPINFLVLLILGVIGGLFLLVESGALWTGTQIARHIHQAVLALHQGTRRLAEDDFEHRIEIDRGDELGELGQAFNAMAEGLKERRQLALVQQALQSEMLVARSIQRRLFPGQVPRIPGLDVAGTSIPSREIGGDAYDYLRWGTGLLVSVADVSGKGVPAALLMSNLQAGLRGHAHRPAALGNVLAELNELILASTDPGQFITLAIAYVDPTGDRLLYASAGHNPPLVRRRNGAIEPLTTSGLLLGVVPEAEYAETASDFNPGDTLVLYTDGVVEAQNAAGEFYDDERLAELLRDVAGLDAKAIRDRIVESVNAFAGSEGPGDDLTVVIVRRI